MNQNEPIFLNLYIRDTESYRKDKKIVGNKQIMRVKKLISNKVLTKKMITIFAFNYIEKENDYDRKSI